MLKGTANEHLHRTSYHHSSAIGNISVTLLDECYGWRLGVEPQPRAKRMKNYTLAPMCNNEIPSP